MLLEGITEVHKPSVIYEYNQGMIFLAKNRQVGMCTKHIDICHHFMRDMVEDIYIDIKYIRSEVIPAYIMENNTSELVFVKTMKRITEGELWELVETGRENVKNARFREDLFKHDKTEYYSHTLAAVADGVNRNDWILVTRSRIDK